MAFQDFCIAFALALARSYPKVTSSRLVYYSILELFGQGSQYICIKFHLHKPSENPLVCHSRQSTARDLTVCHFTRDALVLVQKLCKYCPHPKKLHFFKEKFKTFRKNRIECLVISILFLTYPMEWTIILSNICYDFFFQLGRR